MARNKKEDYKSYSGVGLGYSQAALDALRAGKYREYSGNRQEKYRTSQEQTQQAKSLPVLEGIKIPSSAPQSEWESNFSKNKSHIDIDRARRNYAENYNQPRENQQYNDENYVVKRDRYNKLMQNGRLANDIKTLAEINYKNANQDATVSQEWADEYGAKAITGGLSKSQFLTQLSKRYELTPEELNDMALTFHSDANKQDVADYGKQLEEIGKNHELIGSAGSLVGTLGSGFEGMYNAGVGALTGDDRYLSNIFSTTKKAPREGVKQNIKTDFGKGAYDIGMGIADMAAGAAAGSAPVILAGNTANEAQESAMKRGSSVRKSSAYGAGAGIVDYITNTIGLGNAKNLAVDSIKNTGIKQFVKNMAKAGKGEAAENVIQDLAQSALDAIFNGKNSELAQAYNSRVASGESESDAFWDVAADYAGQLGFSGLMGFGMGSAMQAGETVLPKVPELVRNYKEKNQNLGILPEEFARNLQDSVEKVPEVTTQKLQGGAEIVKQAEDAASGKVVEPDGFVPTHYDNGNGVDLPTERAIKNLSNTDKNVVNTGKNFGEFIRDAVKDGFKKYKRFYYGTVSDELANDIAANLGIDTKGMDIVYDTSHIKHIFDRHGNDAKEATQGFLGVKDTTLADSARVFDKPDTIKWLEGVNSDGNPVFEVTKRVDGVYYVVTGYKGGKKQLMVDSFRIKKNPPKADYANKNVPQPLRPNANNKSDSFDNTVNQNGENVNRTEGANDSGNGGGNVPPTNPPSDSGDRVRSFSERGSNDETLPDEIRNTLSEDYYKIVRNKDVEAKADSLFVPDNLTQTRSNLDRAVEAHDPAAALLSYKLAKAYVDNGDYDAATDVLQNVSAELTRMGQFTQAAKLAMLQNDPMAAMRSYMRDLEKLNQWGSKKYGDKWKNLELSDEDINLINSIQKGDSEGLNAAFDAFNEKFSKQIPATWWDKAVSASKTAMLLNLRTQSRNILANVASLPLRSASDRVAAVGQNIAHLIDNDVKVTQSLTGGTKAQKDTAGQIFDNLKDSITGENKMKDSVKSDILSQRQIFKDDFLAKWIDNLTDGGIQKLNQKFGANGNQSTMETLANLTYWLMGDVGDTPFVKKNFVNRLASYMKAQGIDDINDVPDEAIAIATQEALKATFKDDNAFTKALQGVKQKSGKFGEIALPFVKTPANLTMRAVDYSPAGLINTFRKIKSGADASAVIDDLSKNITGTALIYLGYKLAEKGLLSGSYSSDPDEAEFQKQQGMLENAIHVGDNYYTYDWTQPASTPLLLGQTIYEAVKASDNENASIKDIVNATYKGGLKVANTIINSSPLQSLSDLLGDSQYGDEGVAENIANEIMEFPQRFIPSVMGATARVIDPTIRDTYIKDTSLTGALGNQARQAMAKVPFLSKTLPASYDTWGNERTRSDSQGEAFFAQMVNPGQLGNKNETPLDAEIQRLFDATGNSAVFPLKADRSYNLGNDGTVTLTNKQHSEFQRTMGQRSYSYAESIMKNPEYNNLSDEDKAKILDKAYKLSNALTKEEMFNHVTDSDKKLKEVARNGSADDVAKYLVDGVIKGNKEDVKAEQNAVIKNETNLSTSSNAAKMIKADMDAGNTQAAEQKIDEATQLSNAGFTKPGPVETYYKAKNVVPSLTVDEYTKTYRQIDGADGSEPNEGIKQDELIAYFNNNHFTSEAEAMKYWNMYAPKGKKVPYLKKDGTWGKH